MRYCVHVTRDASPWTVTRRDPPDPPHFERRIRLAALALLLMGLAALAAGLYIPAKAAVAQVLLERAWAQTLNGEGRPRPWPWADIAPVAKIAVPRLKEHAIVLGDVSGEAMAFGPGHMPNSAPIGVPGLAIVAGHRDTHLAFLHDLRVGDDVDATDAAGRRTRFRVRETRVVAWNASGLDVMDGGRTGTRLALVTCYPFGAVAHGPLRYVVLADKVAP